jgi:dephospho-CoA kinase
MIPHIGITGGIGSGKTTVCHIFEQFGVPVYYADDRAKILMNTDTTIIAALKNLFGNDIYLPCGNVKTALLKGNEITNSLNRPLLSKLVFNNPELLAKLNAIVHPVIFADAAKWRAAQTNCAYSLKEAAILIESGGHHFVDKIIVVTAPLPLRVQRVMQRDNITQEAVAARIANQLSDEERLAFADFVVVNDGEQSLVQQVWAIHRSVISEQLSVNSNFNAKI